MTTPKSLHPKICANPNCDNTFEHNRRLYCSPYCQRNANYRRNKETISAQYKKYRTDNQEHLRSKGRARYHSNKSVILAYAKQWKKRRDKAQPWAKPIESAQWRAKKKGIAFDLTAEWGEENWTGCCAVSGIAFSNKRTKSGPAPFVASIDRIDPDKGYTQNNCRFVLFVINGLKHTLSNEEMLEIARAIAKNNSK